MKKRSEAARTALDRTAWMDEALAILSEDGINGVRVEVLAKRLNVTKGSFYWHFRDRQDLLDAVLAQWKDGRIRDILKQTEAAPGAERERLHHVIEVYSAARNRKGIRIEAAMRDWARRDAAVAAVVADVDAIRLNCAKKLFVDCGFAEEEAASRSLLLYSYVFGQSIMLYERFAPDIGGMKAWIADRIAR